MTLASVALVALASSLAAEVDGAGSEPACDLGVVGAGAGGAYAAWRAAADGRSVCVFERASRPGGRIHSLRGQGPRKDLVVEAGGYRFAPKPVHFHTGRQDWNVSTPLTAAIIKELKLASAAYNPNASEWDHGMHKIVDDKGHDVGYLTFIERMLQLAIAHGAKVSYNTKVVDLRAGEKGVLLRHTGGEVIVRSVVLNLPQKPAIELLRGSDSSIASMFPKPLYNPVSYPIMKLYVHYEDAWWRNDLGLAAGPFFNTEPASSGPVHIPGVPTVDPVPLQGQYHDGDVRCDVPPSGRCRGYLQAFYGGDSSQNLGGVDGAIKFFEPFMDSISDDSVVHISPKEPHHAELLEALHSSLVDLHKPALDAANASGRVSALRPTGAVLSMWTQGVMGINAGCHMPKRLSSGAPAPIGALAKAALEPLPGLPIFIANEAYGPVMCFAEGSLAMAESALRLMNVSLPSTGWLSEDVRAGLLEREAYQGAPLTDPSLVAGRAVAVSSQVDKLDELHI